MTLQELLERAQEAGEDAGMVTRDCTDTAAEGYASLHYQMKGYPEEVAQRFWESFRSSRAEWRQP